MFFMNSFIYINICYKICNEDKKILTTSHQTEIIWFVMKAVTNYIHIGWISVTGSHPKRGFDFLYSSFSLTKRCVPPVWCIFHHQCSPWYEMILFRIPIQIRNMKCLYLLHWSTFSSRSAWGQSVRNLIANAIVEAEVSWPAKSRNSTKSAIISSECKSSFKSSPKKSLWTTSGCSLLYFILA